MDLGNRVSCAGIAEYSTHEDRPALLGNGQLEHADGKGLATYGEATNLTGARPQRGTYGPMVSGTPQRCTSESSESGESLRNHNENRTPPESPKPDSPSNSTAAHIERLSLDHQEPERDLPGQGMTVTASQIPLTTSTKRTATSELPQPAGKQQVRDENAKASPLNSPRARLATSRREPRRNNGRGARRDPIGEQQQQPCYGARQCQGRNRPVKSHTKRQFQAKPRDSGYESHLEAAAEPLDPADLPTLDENFSAEESDFDLTDATPGVRYPRMILQPESSPISKEQLATEVKGIYSGLVMVEAKCINIDTAQAAENAALGAEQWQALIALHRTLLYEHHDFLMATQHPSATPALRGLASKYSMPARMWRHGIHAFLEVLRFRRPESQDYMLAFIILAYQMMALLYETVPMFTDTWIECLGDLARYRMAIEEEREQHTIFGGVAARWYNYASDRHPETGRLYHHLGILERPSMRKYYLYAKSLTCIVPFQNAKDSLATLCKPIVEEYGNHHNGEQSAEASIVTFYALIFLRFDGKTISKAASDALLLLSRVSTVTLRDWGPHFVVSNVAALFQLGAAQNLPWQHFGAAIHDNAQTSRPSSSALPPSRLVEMDPQSYAQLLTATSAPLTVLEFCYSAFNALIRHGKDRQTVRDVLPSVHAFLVWFHGLLVLRSRKNDPSVRDTCSALLNPASFDWGILCDFLNLITQLEPIGARTLQLAHQGVFPAAERREDDIALSEDYTLRGLIWCPSYFPPDWFSTQPDDGGRTIESPRTHKARLERVHWLGLYLAFHSEYLDFDMERRLFVVSPTASRGACAALQQEETSVQQSPDIDNVNVPARSSSTPSTHSDSDGYTVVSKKNSSAKARPKHVPKPSKKPRQEHCTVQVVDSEAMQWEQC